MSGQGVHLGRWLRNPVQIIGLDNSVTHEDESYFPLMHFVPLMPFGNERLGYPALLAQRNIRYKVPMGFGQYGTLLSLMREGYRYGAPVDVVLVPTRVHDMGLNAVVMS